MKLRRILAALLAILTVATLLVACDTTGTGNETTPEGEGDSGASVYSAKVNFIVIDTKGNEVYATDPEDPYEYSSKYYEPYLYTFIEDFAFIYDKEFSYEVDKYTVDKKDENGKTVYENDKPVKVDMYTLESITITERKKTKTYSAGDVVTLEDGTEQETYWICLINGKEVDNMNETIIKDGDTVVLRLTYKGQDITE